MTEEDVQKQIEEYNRRETDNKYNNIENCLKEIKKDLRFLPCQSGESKDCLQHESVEILRKGLKEAKEAYKICHAEKLDPLISANLLLNEKVDAQQEILKEFKISFDKFQQQRTEQRISDKQDLMNLELNLTNTITKIQTERETKKATNEAHMKLIKWFIGIILGGIAIWTFISQMLERLSL